MKLAVIASLPLRLPVIKGVVSFFGYCPYDADRCGVNWILSPINCKQCRKAKRNYEEMKGVGK